MNDPFADLAEKPIRPRRRSDYRDLYEEVGQKHGVNPDLLHRQAKQESSLNPRAVGPPTKYGIAKGIAQFIPSTAREYGMVVSKERDDRLDPEKAADAQARLMRKLIDRYKGDERLALSAYNSGTNRSAASARRAMQRIPQTRDYVQKITGGHASIKAPPPDKFADLGEREQDPFSDLAEASAPTTSVVQPTTPPVRQRPTRSPFAGLKAGVQGKTSTPPTGGVGELRRLDEPEVARIQRIQQQVTSEQTEGERALQRAPGSAQARMFDPKRDVNKEALRRVSQEHTREENERLARVERERLIAQFTPEDKAQVLRVADQLRRHGPGVKRGLDRAIQGATSSALYQLAGLTGAADLWQGPNALGDNLRRKALAGELSIEEVADLPQPQREKVAEFLTGMVAGLPALTTATTLGGPVAGFAALGGTEALGRNLPAEGVATETAKGATLGKVFKQAGQIKNVPKELAAIGAGTAATEAAFGTSPEEALQAAGGNILFAGGMKALGGRRGKKTETQRQGVQAEQPMESAGSREATPGMVEKVPTSEGLRRFQHIQFGEVEVIADQTGAGKNRYRVQEVANPDIQHFVKKSDLRGRGNERMVPIKTEPSTEAVPPVVEEARQRIAQRVPQGRSEAPTDLPATPVSAERSASELPIEGAKVPSTPENVASVPFMITRAMEARLKERGYSRVDINKLTPQRAHEILAETPSTPITPEQRATEYSQAERDVAALPAERRLNPRDAGEVWTPERRERAKAEAIARVSEGAAHIELRQRPIAESGASDPYPYHDFITTGRAREITGKQEPSGGELWDSRSKMNAEELGGLLREYESNLQDNQQRLKTMRRENTENVARDKRLGISHTVQHTRADAAAVNKRIAQQQSSIAEIKSLIAARKEVIQPSTSEVRGEPNAVEKAVAPEKIKSADATTRGAGETGGSPAPKITKARLSIRPKVYRGQEGFSISGTDALGRKPKVFVRERGTAEAVKNALAKNEPIDQLIVGEGKTAPSVPKPVEAAVARKAKRAADKAAGIELRRSGADPYELIDNIIVKGWDLYSQKVKPTFEEWSRKLREEFGPESESHLRKVWAQLGGPETTERVRPRQGERSFPATVEEAGYQGGKNRTYDILPNIETAEKANATIKEKGVDLAAAELGNKQGEFSSEDVAVGSRVIQIYEQQGKMDKAIETAESLAEALTKAGQTVQAASIIARLSPEGTLLYAQRKLPAGQKLTPEQGEKLVGQSKKVKTLEDSVKAKDAEATIADLQEQVKFLKKGKPRPRAIERAKEKIGTLEDRLTKMEVDAQARLTQAFGGSTFRSGIDPVILKDLAVVGAVKIAKKGMTAAKWELEMVDKFGEKVKPHLKKIYRSSFDLYDREKKAFRQEQLERSAIKRGASPETLQSEINTRLDEMSQLRKERAEMQRMFDELDQTKWGKRMRTVFDATGIPHAAMTAFDLSFGLRQGKMGFVRHPKIWAEMMKRQVKALNNTEFSRMVSELEADPDFKYAQRFKLEITSPAVSGTKLATKEEGFQSHMAEKIPGIKRSEQAFATAGDWMRMPWFKDYMAKGRRAGFDPENPADFHVFEDGARLINAATGRGNLGKYGNAVAPILNRATFSARFWASRVKMLTLPIDPRTYTTMSKPARVEALKTVFGFYALVGAQLMLARASGATVGLDPDKPDFMKANWGSVHIDFSAGHQGHLRFAAHLVKAIYEEQVQGKKRGDYQTPSAITQTYLRGKEAPLVSLAHDTFFSKKDKQGYGTDIIGRSSYLFGDPKASKFDRVSGSAIMRRLEPLVYQDAKQAYDQLGWSGVGIVTPLVAAGESVQTYQPKKVEPSKFPSVRSGASNVGRPNAGGRP